MDCFLRGMPNVSFAYLVMKDGIAEHMRTEKLTWKEFGKLYVYALEQYIDERMVAEDAALKFRKDGHSKTLPPLALEIKDRIMERSKSSRRGDLNQLSMREKPVVEYDHPDADEPEWDEPPDDDEGYQTGPEMEQPPPEHSGDEKEDFRERTTSVQAVEHKGDDLMGDIATFEPGVDLDDEDLCLAMAAGNKSKFVCFNFANKGVCNHQKETGKPCRYSHEREDVERYLALKKLGGVRGIRDAANKLWSIVRLIRQEVLQVLLVIRPEYVLHFLGAIKLASGNLLDSPEVLRNGPDIPGKVRSLPGNTTSSIRVWMIAPCSWIRYLLRYQRTMVSDLRQCGKENFVSTRCLRKCLQCCLIRGRCIDPISTRTLWISIGRIGSQKSDLSKHKCV